MGTDVIPLAAERRALAEADELPDLARLIDYAETMRVAVRRADLADAARRDWALYSLDAQRKAGTLLTDMPKAAGAATQRGATAAPRLQDVLETATAAEAKHKSKRWQDVAAVPEEVFMEYTTTAEEPTRARLLRTARDAAARAEREAAPVALSRDLAGVPDGTPEVEATTIGLDSKMYGHLKGVTKERLAARWAQVEALADAGQTSIQVAKAVGLTPEGVRAGARKRGIEFRADRTTHHQRRPESTAIVEKVSAAIAAAADSLALVTLADVLPQDRRDAAAALRPALRALSRFAKELEEV